MVQQDLVSEEYVVIYVKHAFVYLSLYSLVPISEIQWVAWWHGGALVSTVAS